MHISVEVLFSGQLRLGKIGLAPILRTATKNLLFRRRNKNDFPFLIPEICGLFEQQLLIYNFFPTIIDLEMYVSDDANCC
jgi:hypothetical protein